MSSSDIEHAPAGATSRHDDADTDADGASADVAGAGYAQQRAGLSPDGSGTSYAGQRAGLAPVQRQEASPTDPTTDDDTAADEEDTAEAPEAAGGASYTVVRGDSLSRICRQHYGNAGVWRAIYDVNRSTVGRDPNRIHPGMVLTLPTVEQIINTATHRRSVQTAFGLYWQVSVSRQRRARAIPIATFRRVHAELLRLPRAHVQGTWTRLLHLHDSSGAYMSHGGEFGLGEDAALNGDGSASTERFGSALLSLSEDAAIGATVLKLDATSMVGAGVSVTIGQGDGAETVSITGVNDARTDFTIASALTKRHGAGARVVAAQNTRRRVNWLEAVVRHEMGHAVENSIGGVTGFTESLGGWKSGTSFDDWATLMGTPWATSDSSTITETEKGQIKTVVDNLRTSPRTNGLDHGLADTHPIKRYWSLGVPVIEAAKPMAEHGKKYWQHSGDYYGRGGRFFTINDYYSEFHAFNNQVQFNQVRKYMTYSPAEFFAEVYTVYYEEAGTENPQYGRLVPVTGWKSWFDTNIHNVGHGPSTGGSTP